MDVQPKEILIDFIKGLVVTIISVVITIVIWYHYGQ